MQLLHAFTLATPHVVEAASEPSSKPTKRSSVSPPCPLCNKTFLARRSLLRHLRNVHGRHDHRELVPSSKAGHDANRLRNRLGRFVRAGEEADAVKEPIEEKAASAPTSQKAAKPSRKREAREELPEKKADAKRPAVMLAPATVMTVDPGSVVSLNKLGQLCETFMVAPGGQITTGGVTAVYSRPDVSQFVPAFQYVRYPVVMPMQQVQQVQQVQNIPRPNVQHMVQPHVIQLAPAHAMQRGYF